MKLKIEVPKDTFSIYSNAVFLASTSFLNGILGFLFWKFAANYYSPVEVGQASGYLALVGLLASISNLGLGFGIVRYVPIADRTDRHRIITFAFFCSGLAAIVISVLYAYLGQYVKLYSEKLLSDPASYVFMTLGTIIWTWYGLTDYIFIAFRNTKYVLVKNLIANSMKLPLPIIFASFKVFSIGAGVLFSMSLGVAWVFIFAIKRLESDFKLEFRNQQKMLYLVKYSLPNYISNWFWQAPNSILPIFIIGHFGASANAGFYIAWMLSSMLNVIGTSIAGALFAEGANDLKSSDKNLINTLIGVAGIQIITIGVFRFMAPFILNIFGKHYVDESLDDLNWLMLGTLGYSVISVMHTVYRLKHQFFILTITSIIPVFLIIIVNYLTIDSTLYFSITYSVAMLVIATFLVIKLIFFEKRSTISE